MTSNFSRSIIILLGIFFCTNLHATQTNIKFRRVSPVGGFTDRAVKKITQDKFGLIWIATDNDLFKYDSYSFTKYPLEKIIDAPSSNNAILDLLIDENNNFWVGTRHGLFQYDYNTDQFKHINYINTDDSNKPIRKVTGGSDSTIIIATDNSLYEFNYYSKKTVKFSLPKKTIGNVYKSTQGEIYVSFLRDGTYKSIDKKTFTLIIEGKQNRISTSYFTDDLIYQAYNSTGIHVYNNNGKFIENITAESGKISHNTIKSIYEDSNGNIWIGTYNGLDIKHKNGLFSHHKHEDGDINSLPGNSVYYVYEDSHNNFWIGTWSGGVAYYNKNDNFFKHMKHQPGLNTITNNYVSCFIEDEKDNLWIGTNGGGLNKYNSTTKEFQYIKLNKSNSDPVNVKSLYLHNNNLYVGTFINGLYKITRDQHISKLNASEKLERIYAIAGTNSGLWIAQLGNGLSFLNLETNFITKTYEQSDDSTGLTSSYITALLNDNGDLWVGTNNGLNLKKKNQDYFHHFKLDQNNKNSVSSNQIVTIIKDNKENIWIGTRSGGANIYDSTNNTFKRYGKEQGISGDDANGILCDELGIIWISGENGISKLDPVNKSIMNYNITDGLQGNQFNRNAAHKSTDGKLYFGGTNGYSIIDPLKINYNPFPPKPIISDLYINSERINPSSQNSPLNKSISETSLITLNHKQSSLTLKILTNNFLKPNKNIFKYRLLGFNQNWEYTSYNSITYNNLNSGTYIFEFMASNNDGIWNRVPKTLEIRINPPWWLTKLAYLTYITLLISIIWLARYVILKRNKEKLANIKRNNDEKISALKLQFFTNISHEFKTPLTLILSPIQRIINNGNLETETLYDLEIAKKNAFRLKKLVNQFIELRKIDKDKLNLYISKTEIIKFVDDIYVCFQELADNNQIDYSFDYQIEETDVFIDNGKIDKVIFNILSNAFKYTPAGGQVNISLKKTPQICPKDWHSYTLGEEITTKAINIVVSDSGKGIPEKDLKNIFERFFVLDKSENNDHSGIGLSLIKEYLLLHKCKISVASKPGEGSMFSIEIPIKNEKLLNEPNVNMVDHSTKPTIIKQNERLIEKDAVKTQQINLTKPAKTHQQVILLVEDVDDLRNYLKRILEENYEVITAANGLEGHIMASKFYPDVIVSDIMMPEMTGLELCEKLKSDLLTSHIPIILLTALAEDEHKIKGLNTGADAYISKPFDIELLISQINNLVETRKKLRISVGSINENTSRKEALSTLDAALLKKAKKFIEDNILNPDISTNEIADVLAMSRTNLHRKLKNLSGQSATQFIKSVRLNYATSLIDNGNDSIEEVCYASGFNSTSYFSKCFKELYKITPSEYKNSKFLKKQ